MALSTMPHSGSAMKSSCKGRTAPASMARCLFSHAPLQSDRPPHLFPHAFSPSRGPPPRSKYYAAATSSSLSFERAEAERAQLLSVCATVVPPDDASSPVADAASAAWAASGVRPVPLERLVRRVHLAAHRALVRSLVPVLARFGRYSRARSPEEPEHRMQTTDHVPASI
jgi:hypothetical protein